MNPFETIYNSDFFCDRVDEIRQLKENMDNGLNTLIHSPRRLGKTAMILHLFHQIEKNKEADTIYIDLFATQNMQDLIQLLAQKILWRYHKLNFMQGVSTLLKGLSTNITVSPDGIPQVSLNMEEGQYKQSLDQLLQFLQKQKKKVVIAFDEFQEVGNYPERAEAELRSHMQQLGNVKFIFSGSSSHLLQEMFQSPKRPFYQSTEVLVLNKIDESAYFQFIKASFLKFDKDIDDDAINLILKFTDRYTYYTHVVCNRCFAKCDTHLTAELTQTIIDEYLESRKIDYQNLFRLLSTNQKKLAVAIAKEELVSKPTAMGFLMKHKLPSLSSTSQAVNTLATKELIYQSHDGYMIYDVFFKRFLQQWY